MTGSKVSEASVLLTSRNSTLELLQSRGTSLSAPLLIEEGRSRVLGQLRTVLAVTLVQES